MSLPRTGDSWCPLPWAGFQLAGSPITGCFLVSSVSGPPCSELVEPNGAQGDGCCWRGSLGCSRDTGFLSLPSPAFIAASQPICSSMGSGYLHGPLEVCTVNTLNRQPQLPIYFSLQHPLPMLSFALSTLLPFQSLWLLPVLLRILIQHNPGPSPQTHPPAHQLTELTLFGDTCLT